jgi:hypothetical protein
MFKRLALVLYKRKNVQTIFKKQLTKSTLKTAPKLNLPPIPKEFQRNTRLKKFFLSKYFTFFYFVVLWHLVGYLIIKLAKNEADKDDSNKPKTIQDSFRKIDPFENQPEKKSYSLKIFKVEDE